MALIQVGNVTYPDPIEYKVDVEPVGVWERNSEGLLVGDLVAYKTKLNLKWGMLSGPDYQRILAGAVPFFLSVTYHDPRTNAKATGTFYASPRSGSLALIDSRGVYWWKDAAFNLIER